MYVGLKVHVLESIVFVQKIKVLQTLQKKLHTVVYIFVMRNTALMTLTRVALTF